MLGGKLSTHLFSLGSMGCLKIVSSQIEIKGFPLLLLLYLVVVMGFYLLYIVRCLWMVLS